MGKEQLLPRFGRVVAPNRTELAFLKGRLPLQKASVAPDVAQTIGLGHVETPSEDELIVLEDRKKQVGTMGLGHVVVPDEYELAVLEGRHPTRRGAVIRPDRKVLVEQANREGRLNPLSERQQRVLRARYLTAKGKAAITLNELGQELGVNRERVRQIEKRAFERLQGRPTKRKIHHPPLPSYPRRGAHIRPDKMALVKEAVKAGRLNGLSGRERRVIQARYLPEDGQEAMTMPALGREFKINPGDVWQIERRALRRLQEGPTKKRKIESADNNRPSYTFADGSIFPSLSSRFQTARVYHALKRAGYTNLLKVACMSDEALLEIPTLGQKGLRELRQGLASMNLG